MTFSSLVGTVTSTSSNAINLINYAMSYDSFGKSDYIIFNDSEYSYYIVWGDLEKDGNQVVANGGVEYIHYYRTSTSGYNSNYVYQYGADSEFSLVLSETYITTSNLASVGFVSSTVQEYEFYNNALVLMVFVVAMVFAIMVKKFRGGVE